MTDTNHQTVVNRDNARITGIQKHCTQQASILVAGVAYTPAQAIQIYQNDLDAAAAVAQARSALKTLVATASSARKACDTFDSAFKRCIEGAYEGQPTTLDDFGIVVVVPRTPTAAVKAAAADKGRATREARKGTGANASSLAAASSSSTTATSASSATAPAVNGAAPAAKS
jgi:hypothetical protein